MQIWYFSYHQHFEKAASFSLQLLLGLSQIPSTSMYVHVQQFCSIRSISGNVLCACMKIVVWCFLEDTTTSAVQEEKLYSYQSALQNIRVSTLHNPTLYHYTFLLQYLNISSTRCKPLKYWSFILLILVREIHYNLKFHSSQIVNLRNNVT